MERTLAFRAAVLAASLALVVSTASADQEFAEPGRAEGFVVKCSDGKWRFPSPECPVPTTASGGGGGDASAANQDEQTALLTTIDADTGGIATSTATTATQTTTTATQTTAINGKLPALVGGRVPVDGSGVTQPVSAASLPLPTGAATEEMLGFVGDDTATIAERTPRSCSAPYRGASQTIAATQTDLSITISGVCQSGTCDRLTATNTGAAAFMLQINGSTGSDGVCLFPSANPTFLGTIDPTAAGGPAVTSLHATNTGTTSCPSGVTPGASEITLYACD